MALPALSQSDVEDIFESLLSPNQSHSSSLDSNFSYSEPVNFFANAPEFSLDSVLDGRGYFSEPLAPSAVEPSVPDVQDNIGLTEADSPTDISHHALNVYTEPPSAPTCGKSSSSKAKLLELDPDTGFQEGEEDIPYNPSSDDDEDECSASEMETDDDEYRAARAKPRKVARVRGGLASTPRQLSSSRTVSFTMNSGRAVQISVDMLEKKAKIFFSYFEKTFRPAKADVVAIKQLRRKHQLRKSSQKGRREQKIKNESLQAELERLSTMSAELLTMFRESVNRHVPAAYRSALLAEVTEAVQDHFRVDECA